MAWTGMPIAPSLSVNKDVSWTAIYYGDVGARPSSSGTIGEADGGGDRHGQLRVGAGYDEGRDYSRATAVGDRYLLERMSAGGYNFGGEQSGHFIFLDHNTTGDGLISALQVLSLMKRTEKPLSELAKAMTAMPQVLLNVTVTKKPNFDTVPELQRAIQESEQCLNGSGRVLVRYSGTEPLLRVMVEGESDDQIREVANRLVDVFKTHLG
jgi:phosphomannomutase